MNSALICAVALAALPGDDRAQSSPVRLVVAPMKAPTPALKYQLLPELRELNPGNAASNYLKCFMEQRHFFYSKEAVAERARFQVMRLSELPVDKLRGYGGGALAQADWAARLDTLDWQTIQQIQKGNFEAVPGELGPIQVLAVALQVRFRGEVAMRKFDDAVRSAKTMFALSRHLGEHPTELGNLVGLWSAHLCAGTIAELIQQPGCPNLYWALIDLPSPLVDLRKGVQGQTTIIGADLRILDEIAALPESELEAFVSRLSGSLSFSREQSGQPPVSLHTKLRARVKDSAREASARRRLIETGAAKEVVQKLSPLHVILLDEKRAYDIERDDRIKLLSLPLWRLDFAGREPKQPLAGDGLFDDLLPNIVKLRQTQAEFERELALLRHVEALRMFAAEHDGKLPSSLQEIGVPLSDDPVTGKPFAYVLNGSTAHLRGGASGGDGMSPGPDVHYEVTIRK
jgi:hypothetical protein